MFSEEVKLAFGLDMSGFGEKINFAPWIGTPRALTLLRAVADDSVFELVVVVVAESEVVVLESLGVGGVSFLVVIFGTLIFGIEGNCPIAGSVRNVANAITAIRISDDDLVIRYSPLSSEVGGVKGRQEFSLILPN